MNGIICWLCSILAILALLPATQRWRNELNKIQEKDVSQPNHDLWWIWPQERLRACLLQLLQTRGGPRMDIKILNNLFLTIERGNPWKRQDQTIHRIMVHPGLLKCGKVDMKSTIDQGNLSKILGIHWKELILIVENIFSAGPRILQGTKETIHERTGRPVSENIQGKANFEKFIVGSDTTEFVNKVKNQVRIRQKRMSDDAEDCTEHSIVWGMFMATTLNAVTFMGKSYSTMQNVVQNEENLTLKQMFDITAQTIHNDEEIYCLDKIEYQRNTWTQLSLINDPVIISLQSTKVYVFSDSVFCLGKVLQHPECNEAWKNRVAGARAERSYRDFEDVKGESTEFEWNIFPRVHIVAALWQNQQSTEFFRTITRNFHRRILFMSMFNDISCDRKGNKDECLANARVVSVLAKRFGIGQWSFIGPGSEKKWYPSENSPQGEWDRIAEDMLLRFAESGHPIFRATTPLSRCKLKSRGHGKLSIHYCADQKTIETVFRIIVSANQLSLYGAIANMCEEFETHQDRSGQLDGTINRAQCDQDRSTFGLCWPGQPIVSTQRHNSDLDSILTMQVTGCNF